MSNPYIWKAKPCLVYGHKKVGLPYNKHKYASRMEGKMATLLINAEISFKPHIKFECWNRKGKPFNYTVDFLFCKPQSLVGISSLVDFVEIKGALTKHDLLRKEALEFCHNLNGWIAGSLLLGLWERSGFDKEGTGTAVRKRRF